MEYNEPLNLSIKKKPIAVVTPSSSASNKVDAAASSGSVSNDVDDPSEHLDTSSLSGVNESDSMNRSSPLANADDTNACHNATDTASVCLLAMTRTQLPFTAEHLFEKQKRMLNQTNNHLSLSI